jgi:hypothetical protein
MRTGRLDGPSISIPGYIPDPNRKTKFGYKECDSEAVNNSPNERDRTHAYTSLSGTTLPTSSFSQSVLIIFAVVFMHLQPFNQMWKQK